MRLPPSSWTWNASGCRIPADAGIAQASDAGPLPTPEPDGAGDTTPVEDAVAPGAPLDAGSVVPEAAVPEASIVPDGNAGT